MRGTIRSFKLSCPIETPWLLNKLRDRGNGNEPNNRPRKDKSAD